MSILLVDSEATAAGKAIIIIRLLFFLFNFNFNLILCYYYITIYLSLWRTKRYTLAASFR